MHANRPSALVVGAGVVGRSVAYHLVLRGFDVVLIDAGSGISRTSRASLGVLTHFNGGDNPLSRLYREGHESFRELSARLREETGVDIGWCAPGGVDLIFTDEDEEKAGELLRFNQERGCPVERLTAEEVRRLEPRLSPQVRGGLYFHGDHRVDPVRLSEALLKGMQGCGGEVVFGEEMEGFEEVTDDRVSVRTRRGRRTADFLVLAAGAWTRRLGEGLGVAIPVRPIRGQHVRFSGGEALRHILRRSGHHLLPAEGRIVVGTTVEEVGFDDAPTPEAASRFREVLERTLELEARMEKQRAGLRPKPKGGRPLIGPLTGYPRIFVATGHYKNGVLMGPVTGRIIAHWMAEGEPPWEVSYFRPER